ncbi:hypothetical protein ANN_12024 [Periplaneta americana]|uniref:Uncharacterized protein n=1 Tax=Periplaneta americana TaxID=6978 RepID=A0ABQ8T875_PERAM|nr:hypothetical protein ANN_12024 [Periplaneta americana]
METSFDEDIAKDTSRIVKDLSLFEAHIPESSGSYKYTTEASNYNNSKMDPYLQKLGYLRIDEDSNVDSQVVNDRSSHRVLVSESGYGRIMPKSIDSQGRSLSSIAVSGVGGSGTSLGYEVTTSGSKSLPASNIASPVRNIHDKGIPYRHTDNTSKFATPKQVETIASLTNKQPAEGQCPISRGNQNGLSQNSTEVSGKYYSAYASKHGAASPTHSLSGSSKDSQHSNSPRTSLVGGAQNYASPLYENIDYYGSNRTPQPPYYHSLPQQHVGSPHSSLGSQDSKHSSPRTSLAASSDCAHYESSFRKAQPQVPTGAKYTSVVPKDFPPYEAPPVYENIQELQSYGVKPPQNYEPAKPGPQVAVYAEHRHYPTSAPSRSGSSSPASPQPVSPRGNSLPPPPPYPGNSTSQNIPVTSQQIVGNIPAPVQGSHYPSNGGSGQGNVTNVPPGQPSAVEPFPTTRMHNAVNSRMVLGSPAKPSANASVGSYYHATPVGTNGGGDYVVMTGGSNTQVQLATSYQRGTSSGVANAVYVTAEMASSPNPSPSPNPSVGPSNKVKAVSGKTLLPYNVTPPRPMGPTEAERKIEELTRQLEEEMEKQEEEGEYFEDALFHKNEHFLNATKIRNLLRNREFDIWCRHAQKGKGVVLFKQYSSANKWICKHEGLSNSEWCDGIKMVGNVAAVCAVPGISQDNRCRHCHNEVETLAHILGYCPHGEGLRNARHHQVRSIIATALKDADYNTFEEVHGLSVTGISLCIDIIAFKESTRSGVIIDPTVHFEMNEEQPAEVDKEKKNIYNPTIPYYLQKYQLETFGWSKKYCYSLHERCV